MATTANGYPVIFTPETNGPLPRLRKVVIPGTKRHLLIRDGSCAVVLGHVALKYNDTVERLDTLDKVWDDWGWAVRPVRGQTSGYSNHAGGVAIDLNATRHPMGVPIKATFTKAQIDQCHAMERQYQGVVIFGGDFQRADGMHWELAEVSFKRVEDLAKRLMKTPRGVRLINANPGLRAVALA